MNISTEIRVTIITINNMDTQLPADAQASSQREPFFFTLSTTISFTPVVDWTERLRCRTNYGTVDQTDEYYSITLEKIKRFLSVRKGVDQKGIR
jgi:hypothetical protein